MKEFRLSTSAERVAGVSFVAVIIVAFVALVYSLRSRIGLMIVCGLGVLAISALLILYVVNVLKSSCFVNAEEKTMEVRSGTGSYTVDLSEAVLLQTVARKGVQATIRALMFTDAQEKAIAVVPTMFSFKSGVHAEPMAKEMAAYLGIEFKQNVPEWEYDREKYKEHEQELAEQQKKEARERRQKRMQMRIEKRRKNLK